MLLALATACQDTLQKSPRLAQLYTSYQALQRATISTSPFLEQNGASQPVTVLEGLPAPTALSWLRRRVLPDVPVSALYKAFRQRQIRLYDGQHVKRVPEHRTLEQGQRLLFPRQLLELQRQIQAHREEQQQGKHSSAGAAGSAAALQQQGRVDTCSSDLHALSSPVHGAGSQGRTRHRPAPLQPYELMPGVPLGLVDPQQVTHSLLRERVLDVTRHAVFLDKPSGLPVQGPGPSLDDLIQGGLGVQRERLRLVHRLDRDVSGVMVLARSQDAATWLSACFQEKDSSDPKDDSSTEADVGQGMGVRRVYWALLAGCVTGRQSGRIRHPVLVEGRFRPAVTDFRVRSTSPEGVTLVELWPLTGRKHQLRIHCARVLGAPIVGDFKYGYQGLEPGRRLCKLLPSSWWHAFSPSTAERALTPLTVKQRRQLAAQRALDRRAKLLAATGSQAEDGSDAEGSDKSLSQAAAQNQGGAHITNLAVGPVVKAQPMPLFLHSRRMVLKLPGQAPVRVKAPVPMYMTDVMRALGWTLPADS